MKDLNSPQIMLLGSSVALRYIFNVVQAMALPPGARIQYRYSMDLLDEKCIELVNKGDFVGKTGWLSYLHMLPENSQKIVVPCRGMKIIDIIQIGSFIVLSIEVNSFCSVNNINEFNSSIRHGELSSFGECIDVKDKRVMFVENMYKHINEDYRYNTWQSTASTILKLKEFPIKLIPALFYVMNISDVKLLKKREKGITNASLSRIAQKPGLLHNGIIEVSPDRDYKFSIFHFMSKEQYHDINVSDIPMISLSSDEETTHFLSHNRNRLDSNYDLFNVDISFKGKIKSYNTHILVEVINSKTEKCMLEFELPVIVKSNKIYIILQIFIVGFFVSLPATIIGLPEFNAVKSILSFVSGCIAGVASLFSFRRTI